MKDFEQKYLHRAKLAAKLLSAVPFVRMVGLNGSLPLGTATEKSDIDFLIITKHHRIWTGRFLSTILIHIVGMRRYGKKIAGRICLNRYQTTSSLDVMPHDDYHRRVFSALVPLYDAGGIYEKYCKFNLWMGNIINQNAKIKSQKYITKNHDKSLNHLITRYIQKFQEEFLNDSFGDWVEKKLKNYQRARILNDPRTHLMPGRVVAEDWLLRFHPPTPKATGDAPRNLACPPTCPPKPEGRRREL
jgi:hypothetical protein